MWERRQSVEKRQRWHILSIFVISPSGSIVHAHRMDGQGPINIETALYQAQTALYTRRPSLYEKQYATDLPGEVARTKLNQYYVSGGLPIIVEDQLIGAIGVGGSRDGDEPCAYTAYKGAGAAASACINFDAAFSLRPAQHRTKVTVL
jgi:uncharacterized protein GlcG (DUF336 family)